MGAGSSRPRTDGRPDYHDDSYADGDAPFRLGLSLSRSIDLPCARYDDMPEFVRRAPEGSFGKVILATLSRSGDPVAVKVLLASRTDKQAFNREVQTLLHIRCQCDIVRAFIKRGVPLLPSELGARHVAYVIGAGEEADLQTIHPTFFPGPAYLVFVEPLMETLATRLLRTLHHRLPLREVLRIAHEVALGLAFLAQHRVVVRSQRKRALPCQLYLSVSFHFQHSDLKPDNIMFRSGPLDEAVLCDLGYGRLMLAERGSQATETALARGGTLLYMAPELLFNPHQPATRASDM